MTTATLNNFALQAVAPSIFATHPQEDVSSKYRFMPTIDVVDMLREIGWNPVMACQCAVRKAGKRGFQKHMIRFRHNSRSQLNVGNEMVDLVLTNSHDRSSAFVFHAGIFRLVCSNGLVVADGTVAKVSVRHMGLEDINIVNAAQEIASNAEKLDHVLEAWKNTKLNDNEQTIYAQAASQLRWDEDKVPVQPDQLLQPRRYADDSSDLWTTMNRVQENLIRGRLAGRDTNGRRRRTREVKSVDGGMKLNRALWTLTEKMAAIKEC